MLPMASPQAPKPKGFNSEEFIQWFCGLAWHPRSWCVREAPALISNSKGKEASASGHGGCPAGGLPAPPRQKAGCILPWSLPGVSPTRSVFTPVVPM